MSRIHVVCASPPGSNPGMATVDLAFRAVARRADLVQRTRFLRLYEPRAFLATHRPHEAGPGAQPLTYEPYLGDIAVWEDSGPIVFWGDFLHAHAYLADVASIVLRLGLAPDARAAGALTQRHLLLDGCSDDVVRRSVLFGGTLVFNRARDYADPSYGPAIERLLRGARATLFRDAWSALRAARVRGEASRPTLGCDPALLLGPGDLDDLPRTGVAASNDPGEVAVFFGRSRADARRLGRFAKDVCAGLGAPARWLPWGTSAFDVDAGRVRAGFRAMRAPNTPPGSTGPSGPSGPDSLGLRDLLETIERSRLVVTDTYHVSVHAWRLGVPAICVVDSAPHTRIDPSAGHLHGWRDKRRAFFASLDAQEYVIDSGEILDRRKRKDRVAHIRALVEDHAGRADVVASLRAGSSAAEAALIAALRQT